MARLNIIVADDHELLREAVKPHLRQLDADISIWEASTYPEVLTLSQKAQAEKIDVDIVLLDLQMPGQDNGDRFAGLRQVQEAFPNTAVVIFSSHDDRPTVTAAIQNGASGFVPKSMRGKSLISALRLVLDGEIYLPPLLAENASLLPLNGSGENSIVDPFSLLSERESTALRHAVKGKTNKEIARELGLQEVTVKLHLRNAYRKIGATNRVGAVRLALKYGYE